MQSSKAKVEETYLSGDPDEAYDIIHYQTELSEEDEDDQRVREGQLLQHPHLPSRNMYIQVMSRIVKAGNQPEHSSSNDVPAAARHLVSHDHVTTITPELAALASKSMNHL
jgi:hypothetical protein